MRHLLDSQRIVLGVLLIVVGAGLIATLLGAVLGVPMVLFGIWLLLQKSANE